MPYSGPPAQPMAMMFCSLATRAAGAPTSKSHDGTMNWAPCSMTSSAELWMRAKSVPLSDDDQLERAAEHAAGGVDVVDRHLHALFDREVVDGHEAGEAGRVADR